ncbi:putative aldo-keto reductase protein [Ensifer adhaerens OV14]|nr:putative aldo-keto reductase protein [Ensifer adhaerens OV14]
MSNEQLTREIGRTGVKASAVGLGTWAIGGWMWGGTDEGESIAAIQASLDAGVTLIDTAPAYGLGRSEEIVGKALAGRRDKAVIATKCGLVWHTTKGRHFFDQDGKPVHRYLGRDAIVHEVEESLKRLGTDHIDLYITHWQDPTTPIEETVRALEDLKSAGKIRAIGASNVDRSELEAYIATDRLDAIQERFSMIDREIEAELLPLTTGNGVATLSYSSLALGLLSGTVGPDRVFSGDDQRRDNPRFSVGNREKATAFGEAIRPIAEKHAASIAQTVIAWTLAQPGVTFALCGARNPAQALDNARAGTIRLDGQDLAAIDEAIAAKLAHMDK